MKIRCFKIQISLFLLFTILAGPSLQGAIQTNATDPIVFTDVASQTKEFIGYYHAIQLTPEQKKIKEQALGSIPAPCCKDFSALTCCCPCNFAKSLWGLSNYLIVKQHYDVAQLKKAAIAWINFTHSNGYAGDGCNKGRCNLPTSADGCGGMDEQNLVF